MPDLDKETLKQVLQNLSIGQQPAPQAQNVPIGKVIAQLQHVTGYLEHLEKGIVSMAAEVQRVSLMNQMFAGILIHSQLITEEQLQQMYHDQVYLPIKKANDDLKIKMEEARAAVEVKESDEPLIKVVQENDTTESSNIILASERFKREE